MADPTIRFLDDERHGLWIRQLIFAKAGDYHAGHLHAHDHVMLVTNGKFRVTVEAQAVEVEAPHELVITATKRHDLTALVDGSMAFCVSRRDLVEAANAAHRLTKAVPGGRTDH